MPAGAGAGAGVLFGMVGAKGEMAAAAALVWSAPARALVSPMAGDDQSVVNPTTPATEATSVFWKIGFLFMRFAFYPKTIRAPWK
jgi:hypothetical protein